MKSIFNFFLPFLSAPTVFPIRIIFVTLSVGEANPGRYFLTMRSEIHGEIQGNYGIYRRRGGGLHKEIRDGRCKRNTGRSIVIWERNKEIDVGRSREDQGDGYILERRSFIPKIFY
jgi:hypothetical protein